MATIHTLVKGSIRERVGKKGTSYQITVDDTDLGRFGGRHTETFKSYADAEKRLAVLENGGRPTGKATVAQWLDHWLGLARTDRKHPKRQRTIESYQNAIEKHINPVIGHLPLAKVRARNLQDLEDNSPLSPSAVGQIHSVLKGAFRLAAVEDLIPTNPMRDVQPPARPSKRIELPSVADVRAILDLAEAEGGELYAMVQVIAHTGTRRAELMGLRWEDIDLSTGRITINGQLLRTRELGLIYQPEPKTASGHRTITVDAKTIDVLRGHRAAQDATMERMGPAYENKGWVFADETGHERMPDTFYKWLISLAKRAGVQKVHPHSFRHFYGSLLTNSGESLADVSSTMGHANPGITQRLYVHSLPGESDHLAARFAGLVAGE